MKWFPFTLAVVLPCAAGWWGGGVFWPALDREAAASISGVPINDNAPTALDTILAIKPNSTTAQRERMAGLRRLGTDDPRALAEALLRLSREGDEGPDALRDAGRALALQSPEACWQFLSAASPDDPVGLRARCEDAAAWAYERDPAAGLAFLSRVEAAPPKGLGEERTETLVKKTLETFPRKDLPVLRDWLATQPEGELKQNVMQTILPRWVTEDLPSAFAAIQAMPAEDGGKNLRFWSLLNNVVKGGKETLSWEEQDRRMQMLAPQERKELLAQMIIERAQQSPEAALSQMSQLEGKLLTGATQALFHQWGERDPLHASRFFDAVAEPVRATAAEALVSEWASKNGAAASAWVAGMAPGDAREAAVRSLSLSLAQSNTQEALTWAGSLTDPAARQEALLTVWKIASKANPGAALSSLNAVTLSAEDKQRLHALKP